MISFRLSRGGTFDELVGFHATPHWLNDDEVVSTVLACGAKHIDFVAGEAEKVEMTEFISRLSSSGFKGSHTSLVTIGVEIITGEGQDPHVNLQKAKSQVDRALNHIQE